MIQSFFGAGMFAEMNGLAARAMSRQEIAEQQLRWAREMANVKPDLAYCMSLQNYRPRVDVPEWYGDWSRAMAGEPVCNP